MKQNQKESPVDTAKSFLIMREVKMFYFVENIFKIWLNSNLRFQCFALLRRIWTPVT